MIRYYDEHGNRLNIRTELDDALDKLYDELDKLTHWSADTVASILSKQEYCGDTVNFRSQRKSFKNKRRSSFHPKNG